jgi:hypothetical protein
MVYTANRCSSSDKFHTSFFPNGIIVTIDIILFGDNSRLAPKGKRVMRYCLCSLMSMIFTLFNVLSQPDIARILHISIGTVRDLSILKRQAKVNVKKYIDERLPERYEKCMVGLYSILREA